MIAEIAFACLESGAKPAVLGICIRHHVRWQVGQKILEALPLLGLVAAHDDSAHVRRVGIYAGCIKWQATQAELALTCCYRRSVQIGGTYFRTVGWEPPLQRFSLDKPSEFDRD